MVEINNFMNFPISFFLNASGLFDFDLTFPAEATLFIILALVVTNIFIKPISTTMDERAEAINFNLRKSAFLITVAYEQVAECVGLLIAEVNEMNRQIKLVKNYTNSQFEEEVLFVQNENLTILNTLKVDLAIKSAYLFSNVTKDLHILTDKFFVKKFQSVS